MSKGRCGLFPNSTANERILRATAYKAIHSMIVNTKGEKAVQWQSQPMTDGQAP